MSVLRIGHGIKCNGMGEIIMPDKTGIWTWVPRYIYGIQDRALPIEISGESNQLLSNWLSQMNVNAWFTLSDLASVQLSSKAESLLR